MSLDKKTVANRYAKAIFELAEENGQLDQTYQDSCFTNPSMYESISAF